jgi:hypothetical protein
VLLRAPPYGWAGCREVLNKTCSNHDGDHIRGYLSAIVDIL